MANSAMELVGDLLLLVHNTNTPTATEWDEYIETTLRMLRTGRGRQLVLTDGGAPSLEQRRAVDRAATATGLGDMPVAVVSGSGFVRFVVSALTFSNPSIRVYAPERMNEACAYLRIDNPADITRRLDVLRAKVARKEEKSKWRPFRSKRREDQRPS